MPKKKQVVEEPSYEVECIYGASVTEDAQWQYNIKWGGYSEEENSWEPEANLNGCIRMLAEFWKQIGPDNKDRASLFPVGHEVTPSVLWIKSQREAYESSQARRASQRTKRTRSSNASSRRITSTMRKPSTPPNDSDDDDVPLSMKVISLRHSPPTEGTDASSTTAQRRVSKRRRDDETASEPSNKRLKSDELSKKSPNDDESEFQISNNDDDSASHRSPSPHDSLFGDKSEKEDVPPAPNSPASVSQPDIPQSQAMKSTIPPVVVIEKQLTQMPKIPLHRERKQNPRIKTMDLPIQDTNMGGLSTKQRILLQGSAKATASSQAKLSLPGGDDGSSSASPIHVESPVTHSSTSAAPAMDAHAWLKENILSKEELTRAATLSDSHPPAAEPSSSTSQVPRFSKRWRWTGQLAVGDNETGFAEPIGNIVVTDNTPLDRNAGKLGFETLLPSHVDTICLRHQYPLSTLCAALRAFKVSQFAVMTADYSVEETAFDEVVSYMTKHELFSQSSLIIADLEAATIFVFPSTFTNLLDRLSIPAKVRQGKGLIVAVGYKAYMPPKQSINVYTSNWKTGLKASIGSETRAFDCNRAIVALNFPGSLFSRLAGKQCGIFTMSSDRDLPGHDSLALVAILESVSGCKVVPLLTGNVRFIFIHVTAWGMLHKLPGLVDRRLRRPDVQFYTYGSDPSVERKRWGVREVFPLGGIVTFTPRAIVEDPPGVEQLIAKLDEHPLWACYILPSVLPMVCEVAEESESDYVTKSGIEGLCSIMLPIEKSQIALTWQPPSREAHDANNMAKWVDWMVDQARLSELRGNDLVEECRKRFERQQDRSEKDVEARIVRDLLVMQSELREEYRRFVIITDTTGPSNTSKEAAASTSVSKADIKDGFELTHVKDFTFNDDYFE